MADVVVPFDSIVKHFESLPDPRHTRNRHHLLGDIIVISVCGISTLERSRNARHFSAACYEIGLVRVGRKSYSGGSTPRRCRTK